MELIPASSNDHVVPRVWRPVLAQRKGVVLRLSSAHRPTPRWLVGEQWKESQCIHPLTLQQHSGFDIVHVIFLQGH